MRKDRPSALVALIPCLVLSSASLSAEEKPTKLGVLVVVDALSWERLEYYRPWYTAGLKRLLDEGLIEAESRYRHLNTETGPGHAALATGAPPRITGIVGNSWFEARENGAFDVRYCVDQRGPGGTIAGAQALRVPTLGDRLLEAHPGARIVSLSGKDRAAILMAGHAPADAVYWWDQVTGRFVTSAAYTPSPEARAVVEGVNRRGAGPGRFGLFWRALPPPEAGSLPQPAKDLEDFQVPSNGLGFPHSLTFSPRGYFPSLFLTPLADELLADLAVAFIEDPHVALGRRKDPDFLALSFSAHDTVAHSYGPDSEEALDVLRRLDLQLGRVFAALDRIGPKGTVALGFSADHGMLPIPEAPHARDHAFRGGRLVNSSRTYPSFTERMNRLLDDALCLDPKSRPVLGIEGWTLAYNRPSLPLKTVPGSCGPAGTPVTSKEIDAVLPNLVTHFYEEEIEEVLLISQSEKWSAQDPAVEFARNDFDRERSGDAFLVPRKGVIIHGDPGRGTGHGSHHEYDIHVPLVFWGGPFAPGRSETASTPYDLAPTLAELLGVRLPDAVGGSRIPK
jgi:hypothetical protein